jgi:16S rRNA (cytosine967-C5)-methyltransferase
MVPLRGQSFDRVLVDAPCTGLGTLRSHPDGKWNKTQDDITRLSQIQKEILRNAAVHLRKGGILVYSTCTLTREENEEVVRDFSRAFEDFEMQRCEAYLPSTCLDLVDAQGIFRTLPHRHGMDGFFAARFRRA